MDDIRQDLKDRQLKLLIAMDEARDSIDDDSDPMSMFRQIARLLKQHFDAEAVALLLVDVKEKQTEAIVNIGLPQDMAHELCREAMKFTKPSALSSSAWTYTLGLRILLDREEHVAGGIVLTHNKKAFESESLALLELAESQIDSAVVQARTIWRLAERNRELEAIYQIDRLRDDSVDEDTLYVSFTSLLIKHFHAEVCQFILIDIDSAELVTRSIMDKRSLSDAALEAIIEATRDIQTTTSLKAPTSAGDLQLLAAPFIVSGKRLGAVVVGREALFTINDTRLMVAMTSQMDSAIAKSRTLLQLEQRTHELEAIYRIDQIRDQESDFDEMLYQVLKELCHAVTSEFGYLLLYNADKEDALEIRASTREDLISRPEYLDIIKRVSREALDTEAVVAYNHLEGLVNSVVSIPLILNTQIIGVFGAINSHSPRGFTKDDGRVLTAITSQVDTAVFERLERRRLRQVLSRSVDPKVLEALLTRADDSLLTGERVDLSVVFADLRGSTEWAEQIEPEELVQSLNTFLGMMTDVIFKHGGTLDKFVGDEVIALFGSPIKMPDHAYYASKAALEMQMVHQKIREEFKKQGRFIPPMGVGISSGEVITGEFGPPIQTDFTAIGRVMNLGARLCSSAAGEQIVISENTYNTIKDRAQVRELEAVPLKGIARTVQTYELIRLIDGA